jgi:hypothetical protein
MIGETFDNNGWVKIIIDVLRLLQHAQRHRHRYIDDVEQLAANIVLN